MQKNQSFIQSSQLFLKAHLLLLKQLDHLKARRSVAHGGSSLSVLFYSQVAWDTVWQRPQELALGLARHRPVVFLSPVQVHELSTRLAGRWKVYRKHPKLPLEVVSPIILSGEYRSYIVRRLNKYIMGNLVRTLFQGERGILLTNSPFPDYLLESYSAEHVVFDLIDDFCAFNWAPSDARRAERRLIECTDLAVAGTGFLRKKFSSDFPDLEFLPSGVDFNKLTKTASVPKELEGLPRPWILYTGTLNDRVDPRLFAAVADEFTEGSLIVVGPCHQTFQKPERENIFYTGLKPHGELPGFYQHCDLGIMPFANNDAAKAINPVKTLEYLACGLPVVSTPVPDVIEYYPEVVRISEPGNFSKAAREEVNCDSEAKKSARVNFARNRSWKSLCQTFEKKLKTLEDNL